VAARLVHVLSAADHGAVAWILEHPTFEVLARVVFVDQARPQRLQADVLNVDEVELDRMLQPAVNAKLPAPGGMCLSGLQDTLVVETGPTAAGREQTVRRAEPGRAVRSEQRRVCGVWAPLAKIEIGMSARRPRGRRQADPDRPHVDASQGPPVREVKG
jgi:hypothetical protein